MTVTRAGSASGGPSCALVGVGPSAMIVSDNAAVHSNAPLTMVSEWRSVA
jgi:hypothetical protein